MVGLALWEKRGLGLSYPGPSGCSCSPMAQPPELPDLCALFPPSPRALKPHFLSWLLRVPVPLNPSSFLTGLKPDSQFIQQSLNSVLVKIAAKRGVSFQ